MNLDTLLFQTCPWLRGGGEEGDIVISSRIRLARMMNLRYTFLMTLSFVLFVSAVFGQKPDESGLQRVAPSDFIIFPWGGVPSVSSSGGTWGGAGGDLADMDAIMKDLYDCGYNTSGFISPQDIPTNFECALDIG